METQISDLDRSPMQKAARDLREGLARWELWGTLGWNEIRQRYRRSVIGPFWITVSMGIMVSGLGVLYASLWGMSTKDYIPYLTIGFVVWHFMAQLLIESCQVFSGAGGVIRQIRVPLSVHVFQMLWRNLIILLHNVAILMAVMLVYNVRPGATAWLAVPGFFLICFNSIWVGLLLGLICTRFRDVPQIVTNAVQIFFFFTPVFWKAEQLAEHRYFVAFNPFHHLLELVRTPLLGEIPAFATWVIIGMMTVVGWGVTLPIFTRYRSRIAFWV